MPAGFGISTFLQRGGFGIGDRSPNPKALLISTTVAHKDEFGGCPDTARAAIRRVGSAKLDQASVRNVRTWLAMAKGKGASGSDRKAESTDAPERGGLPRGSDESSVMGLEPRGQAIAGDLGQLVRREEPFVQRKAAAFTRWHEPDDQVGEINAALRGHYAYYGVGGNVRALFKVYRAVERYWHRMLRSRSWAGEDLTWAAFHQIKQRTALLRPKLRLPYRAMQALAVL